jgi:two-component system, chemotaxis family, sensor kinase CheA
MDEIAQLRQTYFQECDEVLSEFEGHLMALDEGRGNAETLRAAFRAIHSIKGGASAFGYRRLVNFAHALETLLDKLRNGSATLTADTISLLLRAADIVADLVRAAQSGGELIEKHESAVHDALVLRADAGPEANAPQAASTVASVSLTPAPADKHHFRIAFNPKPDLFQRGVEPQLLIAELRQSGSLTATADASAVPALEEFDPKKNYLTWTLELETAATAEAIAETLSFVADEEELSVTNLDQAVGNGAMHAAAGDSDQGNNGDLTAKPAAEASPKAAANGDDASGTAPVVSSIRVDLHKLDTLVNLVGELVISQAMLNEQLSLVPTDKFPGLIRGVQELSQHARNLQESVMSMRAQPVKLVFARLPRLVREVAAETGKRVRLVMIGEDTEIDKTVIEHLHDPLTHMIRNAIDHGIETPEERMAMGKPPEGVIRVSASHIGGKIVIQLADDGRGINRQKVLARAIEKDIVLRDQQLNDEQIDNLIFAPGLTTAAAVSNISGRGVGMDIVRRNIQRLGGRITIRSTPGIESIFYLSLPLTLAVLDGMVVRVGDETYVVPLSNMVETLRPQPGQVRTLVGGGDVLSLRGEYVPMVYLHRQFAVEQANTDISKALVMLVETDASMRIGLVVDEIVGQQQVVIKSLESNYDAIHGIGGATILGNGRVALIVDVSMLLTGGISPDSPFVSNAA